MVWKIMNIDERMIHSEYLNKAKHVNMFETKINYGCELVALVFY